MKKQLLYCLLISLTFLQACDLIENANEPVRMTFKDLYRIESDGLGYKVLDVKTKEIKYLVVKSSTTEDYYNIQSPAGNKWGYMIKTGKSYGIEYLGTSYRMIESIYGKGYDIYRSDEDFTNATYIIRDNILKGKY